MNHLKQLVLIPLMFGLLLPKFAIGLETPNGTPQEPESSLDETVIVHLKEQYDLSQFNAAQYPTQLDRGQALAKILTKFTKANALRAFPFLFSDAGVKEVTFIWLTNSLRVVASPNVIKKIQGWSGSKIESINFEQRFPIEEIKEPSSSLFSPIRTWAEPKIAWGVEKLKAPEVWKEGFQGQGSLVALIDTGANTSHPDLLPNIWNNPGEQGLDKNGKDKATNKIDDDNNGYIDDLNGFNFEHHNAVIKDDQGHGSQTAGIVGGAGTGGTQTGVAPKTKMMILKACCSLEGDASETAIMEAIQYAIQNGAKVISMSLSIKPYSDPNYRKWRRGGEVELAAEIIHINSAGNLGSGSEPHNIGAPASNPPAWYHLKQTKSDSKTSMITIGATDEQDLLRDYSGVGPVSWEDVEGYLDFPFANGKFPGLIKPEVCAPSEVPSTSMAGADYTSGFGGTSSATPHIGGVVALLISLKADLNPSQVTEALQMSAIPVGEIYSNHCGSGRVDALAAMDYVRNHFRKKLN